MSTVAQIFARTLKQTGVRFVFGVPSGNMTDYIEALRIEDGIEFVLVGHETTAAFMAGVCGRLTKIPGVCFGTFGPGATNLSTGVGGAFLDRFPLIAFTDEMPDHLLNRTVQMNIDHQTLFAPITKWTTRLNSNNVNEIILKASGIALSGVPGPVHIGVPSGIGMFMADESEKPLHYLRLEKESIGEKSVEAIINAKALFQMSAKPLLAVGLSAVWGGVGDLIAQIAEKYSLPVVLTPMSKGIFPEDHELYAGVLFHALSNHVAQTYLESDLIIGIGYNPVEFNYEDWMPHVPLIHFDGKPADIDRESYTEIINVIGDLDGLLIEFLKLPAERKNWDRKVLVDRKNAMFQKFIPGNGSFGPLAVVNELRQALPENGILTVDVGAHLHLIGQMWQTPSPEKLLMTNGWSSMGFAIPAALAAKLCHPELPVAAIMGDGGFLMTVGELATAKRLNLKIVFVVIYDNSLSLIRIKQDKRNYNSNYGTDLNELPAEPTNHYFGVPVIRATNSIDYRNALEKAFSLDGPVVIEAVVDGSEYDQLVLKPNK
jgi:acetolactate synthase-1/2/3 large subunit